MSTIAEETKRVAQLELYVEVLQTGQDGPVVEVSLKVGRRVVVLEIVMRRSIWESMTLR